MLTDGSVMKPSRRTRKDVIQEYRRSELLAAARTVFSQKGFHGATIEDVANEAGVAKGTVYLYFDSKNAIYLAALRDGVELLNNEMRGKAAAPGPAEDRLRSLIAAKIAFFDANRDFFQILQSEAGRIENIVSQTRDLYFQQAGIIEGVILDGIKEGSVRDINAKKAAFAVADLTKGIAVQRLLGWSKTRLKDEIEFMFRLVWKGMAK